MSAVAVARSSLRTSLSRYGRSWGLWLLLLTGPVGARFMVARDDGSGIQIVLGGHLPVLTSATLGVSLGVVVTTLLLPVGFLYLRSNTTRRQPWQVEEVSPASRIAVALGRFGADATVLLAMLAALTLAGWFLGWLIVAGPLDVGVLTMALWLVAAPAMIGLAALRILFDALPWLRRGWGEAAYLVLWITSLVAPISNAGKPGNFASNLVDYAGFVRPLVAGSDAGSKGITIGGGTNVLPGRIPVDVMAGLMSDGYIASRLTWVLIAVAIAAFAGLVYRPHRASSGPRATGRLARLLAPGAPPAADSAAPVAPRARWPVIGLIVAEARLIGAGRAFLILAVIATASGLVGDFRHIGSPATLLLLIFGLTAHAGRSEARGLIALTATTSLPPMVRRAAFVVAGTGWSVLLAVPAALSGLSSAPLLLNAMTGVAAALTATVLATVSGSAFAPRLVLLVAWYGYLSS